jgi:uncharacterized protein (TIGR02246 family)
MRMTFICLLFAGSMMAMSSSIAGDAASDEQSVRQVATAYEEAWNKHDMGAMAALFTDDVEWVNIVGMWWRGLSEVKRGHKWVHEALFKNTPIHIDSCSVRLVSPGAAISIVTWSKGSFVTPDSKLMPEGKDRMSLFLVKRGGRWLIASGHNTTIDAGAQQYNPNRKEQ